MVEVYIKNEFTYPTSDDFLSEFATAKVDGLEMPGFALEESGRDAKIEIINFLGDPKTRGYTTKVRFFDGNNDTIYIQKDFFESLSDKEQKALIVSSVAVHDFFCQTELGHERDKGFVRRAIPVLAAGGNAALFFNDKGGWAAIAGFVGAVLTLFGPGMLNWRYDRQTEAVHDNAAYLATEDVTATKSLIRKICVFEGRDISSQRMLCVEDIPKDFGVEAVARAV